LEKFVCLQRETGGRIFDTSLHFDVLINEALEEKVFTGYALSLLTHECFELCYKGKNYSNRLDLNLEKDLKGNQIELFIEFRIKNNFLSHPNKIFQTRLNSGSSSFVQMLFQLQLSSLNSKRIITHSIDVRKDTSLIQNEQIIHVNSLEKLITAFWDEKKKEAQKASSGSLKVVKENALHYDSFLKTFKMNDNASIKTIDFLKNANLNVQIADETAAFLSDPNILNVSSGIYFIS